MTETRTRSYSGETDRERTASDRTHEQETENETTRADEHTTTCPECDGSLITDTEHGETVCADCGLVVEADSVDRGPEWRAFDASERDSKSRVGAPTTNMMHDKGLSTNIGWQDK
ncbi:TFIIB-type zinc ribbon-containing protein, partial [Halorubrum pallidum]